MPIIPLIIAVLAGTFGNIFIKIGTKHLPDTLTFGTLHQFLNAPFLFGVFLLFGSFPFYSVVLQRLPITVAFPLVTSTSFILVVVLSYFFFKEPLTLVNLFGILLLIAGLFLVAHK